MFYSLSIFTHSVIGIYFFFCFLVIFISLRLVVFVYTVFLFCFARLLYYVTCFFCFLFILCFLSFFLILSIFLPIFFALVFSIFPLIYLLRLSFIMFSIVSIVTLVLYVMLVFLIFYRIALSCNVLCSVVILCATSLLSLFLLCFRVYCFTLLRFVPFFFLLLFPSIPSSFYLFVILAFCAFLSLVTSVVWLNVIPSPSFVGR